MTKEPTPAEEVCECDHSYSCHSRLYHDGDTWGCHVDGCSCCNFTPCKVENGSGQRNRESLPRVEKLESYNRGSDHQLATLILAEKINELCRLVNQQSEILEKLLSEKR